MDDIQSPHTRVQKEHILASAHELTTTWAEEQLSSYTESLENQLFTLAENADNNDAQGGYFQARNELKHHQKAIHTLYLQQLNEAFGNYRRNKATTTDFNLDPLHHQHSSYTPEYQETFSLVDNDELEEQLAIGSMSRRVSADCSEALYALNQRLSALRKGPKINEQGNPVAPGVFGEALQTAINHLNLDNRAKLVIYKVFENAFMGSISTLYDALNKHCESNGILPNLSYKVKKQPAETVTEQLPNELKNLTNEASIANQVALIETIRLIQARLQAQVTIPKPAASIPVPAEQIIASIQQLQLSAGTTLSQLETPQAVTNSDTSALRLQAEQEARKTADDVDAGTIEIVGLLFEYMLNVQQLPDSVKTVLSYLHTPFLKMALVDKDFFNHPEHPARQLLNSLVAAGERWVEPTGKHKNDVFQKIKAIVQRLLNEFDRDVRLFSELAFEFNHYLRQHAHRIRLAEKRAMQVAKGENTLKEIRLKVDAYLKKKIGNNDLPAAIQTLLFEPWANFLSFNLLRFGSRSEQWRQAALAVDDILWYCHPHDLEGDIFTRKRLQELQASLPVVLQAGFDTVGYDDLQGRRLLKTLQERQQTAIANAAAMPNKPIIANIDEMDISKPIDPASKNSALLTRLKSTEPGTWFEFNADGSNPQRVKLAWSDTNTLQFMFVNRMGQQVAAKSSEQLIDEIRSGKTNILTTLEDRPFFEQAMERVLEQLKQREGKKRS